MWVFTVRFIAAIDQLSVSLFLDLWISKKERQLLLFILPLEKSHERYHLNPNHYLLHRLMHRSSDGSEICDWGFSKMGSSTTFQNQNTEKRLFSSSCEKKLDDTFCHRGVHRIYIWASWLVAWVRKCNEEDLPGRGSRGSRSYKGLQAENQRGKDPQDPKSKVLLSELQSWSMSRLFQGVY